MDQNKLRHMLFAAATIAALFLAPTAHAGAFRTFLSFSGADGNDCSVLTPCRLLPAALAATNDGGEVWLLDSANYNTGNVVINKSVTILAVPGAVGSFVGNGADALTVNAAGAKVNLRNLVFVNLSGASNSGVTFAQGTLLTVRDSSFTGLGTGVTVSASSAARTDVFASTFTGNGAGMRVFNGRATVKDSDFTGNTIGIEAAGNGGASLNPPNGTTMVFVNGGNVLDNSIAYHMDSTGTRQSGQCNGSNIYLFGNVHAVGNATYISVTGASDHNTGCDTGPSPPTIGGYSSQQF
jgi:hypothetical protein